MKSKNNEYKIKFNENNYDRLYIVVEKGNKKVIAEHATKMNESVNGFVNRAITETMENDVKN